MKTFLSLPKLTAFCSLVTLTGVYASGCADPDSEMYIRGVLAFPTQGECVVKADAESAQLLEGTMDVSLTNEYRGVLLVGNQLVSTDRAPDEKPRTETNKVAVYEAEVTVQDAQGNQLGDTFTVPASGSIEQATGGRPSFGLVFVTLVDGASAKKSINKTVTSKVRVRGRALGGQEVHSNEFQFNVRVGDGNLIFYEPDRNDPTVEGPNCKAAPAMGGSTQLLRSCLAGQDAYTSCSLCSAAKCQQANP